MGETRPPGRFLRLRLILLGVALGFALRLVLGPYDSNDGSRQFRIPDAEIRD